MWTYVVGTDEALVNDARIKIGKTTNVDDRLAAIQATCPKALHVHALYRGDYEAELHEHWSELRLHGEWFRTTTWTWKWLGQHEGLWLNVCNMVDFDFTEEQCPKAWRAIRIAHARERDYPMRVRIEGSDEGQRHVLDEMQHWRPDELTAFFGALGSQMAKQDCAAKAKAVRDEQPIVRCFADIPDSTRTPQCACGRGKWVKAIWVDDRLVPVVTDEGRPGVRYKCHECDILTDPSPCP